ncbi:MAG: PQQ-dependent sugar dehydrogenase [Gemmatimonadaceae bacterium]|nr:PQQ-dependent sugar dehydrogenase [Gemmatimonadaceae bacterium]
MFRNFGFALLLVPSLAAAQGTRAQCAPDNAGLRLPDGFCAQIVADSIGPARHITVAPNGDLFVAVRSTNTQRGALVMLRDTNNDGTADVVSRIGALTGSEAVYHDGYVYFGTDTAIVRYRWSPGGIDRGASPDTVVMGLRAERGHHAAKSFAISRDGSIFVNIGAPSNACEERMNAPGTKGQDPCPFLETSGGIWRFDAKKLRQSQADGERWATGIRNIMAITMDPAGRIPWGTQHGRDLLASNWGKTFPLYTEAKSAENPGEEMFRLDKGGDFGWPYCYWDVDQKKKVLAPEYGGDGVKPGKCAAVGQPMAAYPGHWAPNGMVFYTANAFPAKYRQGAFIAFHGSWNRAPLPQAGFNVVYQPFASGRPSGAYEIFADGFRGAANEQQRRPTGLAVASDGSLLVTDDRAGRVYRIRWVGGR